MENERNISKPRILTGRNFQEIKKIQDRHSKDIMPNYEDLVSGKSPIRGFGIGRQEQEDGTFKLAFMVSCLRDLTEEEKNKIGEEIEGVPVVYNITGEFIAGHVNNPGKK